MSWWGGSHTLGQRVWRTNDPGRAITWEEERWEWPRSRFLGGDQSTAQAPFTNDAYGPLEPGPAYWTVGTKETQSVVESSTQVTAAATETQLIVETASPWVCASQVTQVAVETLSKGTPDAVVTQSVVETLSSVVVTRVYSGTTAIRFNTTSSTSYVPASAQQTWDYSGTTAIQFGTTAVIGREIDRTGTTGILFDGTSPVSRTIVPPTGSGLRFNPTSPTGQVLPNTWEHVGITGIRFNPTSETWTGSTGVRETQTVVEAAMVLPSSLVATRETQTVVETASQLPIPALQTQLIVEVATHNYVDPCSEPFAPGADLCGKRDRITWVTWDPGDGVKRLFTHVQVPELGG